MPKNKKAIPEGLSLDLKGFGSSGIWGVLQNRGAPSVSKFPEFPRSSELRAPFRVLPHTWTYTIPVLDSCSTYTVAIPWYFFISGVAIVAPYWMGALTF